MNVKGSKHLRLEEQEVIQELLDLERRREVISQSVAKDRKTISLEIKLRRNKVQNQRYGLFAYNAPFVNLFIVIKTTKSFIAKYLCNFMRYQYIFDSFSVKKFCSASHCKYAYVGICMICTCK